MANHEKPDSQPAGRSWDALDQELDSICERFEAGPPLPSTLYHYTSWPGLKGILASREVWATSHECTNDDRELRTADDAVREIAQQLEKTRDGTAALTARLLLEKYDDLAVSSFVPTYLACFSEARDHGNQWRMYGDEGRGVCLGVRVLRDDPALPTSDYDRTVGRVGYSESAVRDRIAGAFTEVVDALSRYWPGFDGDRKPFARAVTALYRIAGVANVTTKEASWASEQEWRLMILPKPGADVKPRVRQSRNGEDIRYLSVPLRAPDLLVSLDEITIGPAQDAEESRLAAVEALKHSGYTEEMPEWPAIRFSSIELQ
jgi:hypothetical protein